MKVNFFELLFLCEPANSESEMGFNSLNEQKYGEAVIHFKNCLKIYLSPNFDNKENIANIRKHHYENLLYSMNANFVYVLNKNLNGEDMEVIKKAFKELEEEVDKCNIEELKNEFNDKLKIHRQYISQRELKKFFKEEKYEEILSKIDNNINDCIPDLGDLKNSLIKIKEESIQKFGQKLLKENKVEQIKQLLVKYPILLEKFPALRRILERDIQKKNKKEIINHYEEQIKKNPNDPRNYSKKSQAEYYNGNIKDAIDSCNRGLQKDPKNPELRNQQINNFSKAIKTQKPLQDEQKQFLKDQINSSEKNIVKNTIGTIIEGIKSGNKNMLDNKSINDLFKLSSQNKNVININDKKLNEEQQKIDDEYLAHQSMKAIEEYFLSNKEKSSVPKEMIEDINERLKSEDIIIKNSALNMFKNIKIEDKKQGEKLVNSIDENFKTLNNINNSLKVMTNILSSQDIKLKGEIKDKIFDVAKNISDIKKVEENKINDEKIEDFDNQKNEEDKIYEEKKEEFDNKKK